MIDINLNEKSSNTQRERILSHLQSGKTITAIEALEQFGCFRLSARIKELKNMGYCIVTKMILTKHSKKRVAEYKLMENSIK